MSAAPARQKRFSMFAIVEIEKPVQNEIGDGVGGHSGKLGQPLRESQEGTSEYDQLYPVAQPEKEQEYQSLRHPPPVLGAVNPLLVPDEAVDHPGDVTENVRKVQPRTCISQQGEDYERNRRVDQTDDAEPDES